MSEQDTMAVLAAVLSDPEALKSRLKDLNAAKKAAEFAKLENDKRVKEAEKTEAEAQKVFMAATKERQAAENALRKAEDERKAKQAILDKIGIREAEVSGREDAAANREKEQNTLQSKLAQDSKVLDERQFNIGAKEKELTVKLGELDRKLKIIKSVAA